MQRERDKRGEKKFDRVLEIMMHELVILLGRRTKRSFTYVQDDGRLCCHAERSEASVLQCTHSRALN